MVHFSLFGGYEGLLEIGRTLYVTIFAGSEVRRPPLARLLVEQRQNGAGGLGRKVFLTVFGGAEVIWPTITEEYLALRDALRSGELELGEWDRRSVQNGAIQAESFSLFGSFDGNKLPSEDKELDDLSMQRHLGQVPDAAVPMLMMGVGQNGMQRLTAVRQAVTAALALPAAR